jgi:hypothetical protein
MKVYIVHVHYHYDDYKRSESYSKIEKVYTKEEDAYKYSIEKIIFDSLNYARFNYVKDEEYDEEYDFEYADKDLEECIHNFNSNGDCEYCGKLEMTQKKIEDILNDESKTYKDRYYWIKANLIKIIGACGEFTMFPTHTFYYVTCIDAE